MEKIWLKIIRTATYLILFTPLMITSRFFFPYVGPKSIYFIALSEIIFFAYLFLILSSKKYRPKFNVLLLALSLFLIVLCLSSYFGVDFQNSFWSKYERVTGLFTWFHLFAFFVVLSSVFKGRKEWLSIFGVSLVAAVFVSCLSILEKTGINLIGTSSRGGATLGNSSFLGTYLVFNFFIALYLFFETNPERLKDASYRLFNFCSLLGMGLIGLALWFSEARTALLSAIGGVLLFSILYLIFSKKKILKYIGISVMVICLLAVVYSVYFAVSHPKETEEKLVEQFGSSAIVPRIDVYEMSIEGVKEKPLLGWGPENFALVFTKNFNSQFFTEGYGADIWYDKAHNIVFDTLVSCGILGLSFYLLIFITCFYILWKKYLKGKINLWTAGIFSVVLIAYFVQNLTVFDMVSSLLMWFLILGFIGSLCSENSEPQEYGKVKFSKLLSFIILIAFCFSFFNFVIQPSRKGWYIIKTVNTQPFSEERFSLYEKTLSLSPLGQDQVREFFADAIITLSENENIGNVPKENVIREFDFIANELRKSIERVPSNYRLTLKLGKLYNAYFPFDRTKTAEAGYFFEKAIELSPSNQQAYWSLAQTKLFENKIDEAISLAEEVIELEPKVLQSHLILIQIMRIKGDRDLLEEKIREALGINLNWAESIGKALGAELERHD